MDYGLLALFGGITAVVVVIEHLTFGQWWKRNEIARRVMGHGTILALVALSVPFGLIDTNSAVAIGLYTGVSGVVMGAFRVKEGNELDEKKAQALARMKHGESNS